MERVQVEIFGQTYRIKGGSDSARTHELADFLDRKMKEVEKATGTVDPLRVAILAALTISDELYRLQEEFGTLEKIASNSADRLVDLSEPVMDDAATKASDDQ